MPLLCEAPQGAWAAPSQRVVWEESHRLQSRAALSMQKRLDFYTLLVNTPRLADLFVVQVLDAFESSPTLVMGGAADDWFGEASFAPSGTTLVKLKAASLPDLDVGADWG